MINPVAKVYRRKNTKRNMNQLSDDFGLTPLQLETRFWGHITWN